MKWLWEFNITWKASASMTFGVYHFPNMRGSVYEYLYPFACRLMLHILDSHLFLTWAAPLASANVSPVHWMMVSFHCILSLPLPLLPSTMPSFWSHCKKECLMVGPKIKSFLEEHHTRCSSKKVFIFKFHLATRI